MMTDQGDDLEDLAMYDVDGGEEGLLRASSGDHDQLPSVEEYKAATGHRKQNSFRRPDPFGKRSDQTSPSNRSLRSGGEGGGNDPPDDDSDGNQNSEEEQLNTELEYGSMKSVTQQHSGHAIPTMRLMYGVCFVLLIVIISIVVGTNNKGTAPWRISKSRFTDVQNYLIVNSITSRVKFEDKSSPQYMAAEWIADLDQYQIELPNRLHAHHSFIERYVLAVIYFATGGEDKWTHQLNFLNPNHVCTWYQDFRTESTSALQTDEYLTLGVHGCKMVDGELVPFGLYLSHNDLTGEIPDEIGQLSRLEILLMQYNPNLSGPIPVGLKALSNSNAIRKIALQACSLTGSIPQWIGTELKSLEYLGLGNNKLSGPIPSTITEMPNLEVLALDDNDFTANIDMFHPLTNIRSLLLEDNRITGTLSNALFASWKNLTYLDLSDNMITGTLPDGLFAHNYRLRILDLHGNDMTGKLSDVNIPSNDFLEFLALHKNRLDGTIPASISNLEALEHLDLSSNGFTGTLPTTLGDMRRLRYLFTNSIPFEPGRMPSFLQDLTNLRELGMKGNSLTGQFPNWIHFLKNLKHLDLHNNELTGTIPEFFGFLSHLEHLLLNRNMLTGTLPSQLNHLDKLEVLLLDKNGFVGDADIVCEANPNGIDTFVSDCKSGFECTCCTLCCDDNDRTCNAYDWEGNLDPIWEYQYQRGRDAFELGPFTYVVPP